MSILTLDLYFMYCTAFFHTLSGCTPSPPPPPPLLLPLPPPLFMALGKGYGEPIAMEGALKLKEMCYVHAEGYSGGALKHGPFALIEGTEGEKGNTPVFCIILGKSHPSLSLLCS